MSGRTPLDQIAFRYRPRDSATGVTRKTAKRLVDELGVDETQVIHLALSEFAARHLPRYERDEGPLTGAQYRQIDKHVPQGTKRSIRSSLLPSKSA